MQAECPALGGASSRKRAGLTEPSMRWATTALGKFWGNGSFNMTITATSTDPTEGADMNTKKLAAKVAGAAIVVLVPIATLSASGSASQKHPAQADAGTSIGLNQSAPNAWASRLSGLPSGDAALFDGLPLYGGSGFYNIPAAPAAPEANGP